MMKVETYLINLDGSNDRLENATKQLKQQNFPFVRFPAYDGRGKPLSDFKNYDDVMANQIMGRSLISSELGCYLSHAGCVQKFLETDADYLIVLEDDLKMVDDFKVTIDGILAYLDEHKELDWYVANLAAKKNKLSKTITVINGYELVHAYYFPIRAIGLIWSRKGAEEFVKLCFPMNVPVDNLIQSWLCKNGKGLSVWSPLLCPSGLESDIDGAVATQGQKRNAKEVREFSYTIKKQKRMWRDRFYAIKNLVF